MPRYSKRFAYTHNNVWEDLEFIYDFLNLRPLNDAIYFRMYTRTKLICEAARELEPDVETYIRTYF